MIRHLIFDMDGTLVDSSAICVDILTGMLADRGSNHVIDPVAARYYMSHGGAQMVAALLSDACGDPEAELAEFRSRYQRTTTPLDALFPGVLDGLSRLHDAGFTLSICSNKPQNLCEQVLDDTGLAPLFSAVVGGQPGLRPKPERDLLDATVEVLGAKPADCLYIGDSELDHQVAQAMRIPFVFMSYGYAAADWQPDDCDRYDCFARMSEAVAVSLSSVRAA